MAGKSQKPINFGQQLLCFLQELTQYCHIIVSLDPHTSKRLRKHIKAAKAKNHTQSCKSIQKHTEARKTIKNYAYFVMLKFGKVCKPIRNYAKLA